MKNLSAIVFVLVAGALNPLNAQDRLLIRGTDVPIFREESPDGVTLLPPSGSVLDAQWLLLGPVSSGPLRVTVKGSDLQTFVFPLLKAEKVSYAIPVSPGLVSLTLSGRLSWPSPLRLRLTERINQEGSVPLSAAVDGGWEFLLPPWKAAPGYTPSLTLNAKAAEPVQLEVTGPEGRVLLRLPSGTIRFEYSPEAWGVSPRQLRFSGLGLSLTTIQPRGTGVDSALPADAATLLRWPITAWRNPQREWFEWADHPGVFVLVTKDYAVQDRYLKRLAFFIEKTGFRGHLSTDEQMKFLHGWNAHDYSPDSLAQFFDLAQKTSFQLHPEEVELRDLLLRAGVIRSAPNGYEAGSGALLGVSVGSPPALREFLFTHESFHGLYFDSGEFRAAVLSIWSGLTPEARDVFRSFLALSRYDPQNEPLMINEFQAYCLQQRPEDWNYFFRDKVLRAPSQTKEAEVNSLLKEFVDAAGQLNLSVQKLFGVSAGDVYSVKFLEFQPSLKTGK